MLKDLRSKENYSTKEMAVKLKISKTYYWQLENKRRTLSYQMAIKIADIFNLKPDDIFFEEYKSKN